MGTEGVHEHSTRVSHHRRHGSAKSAAAVVAVLFLLAVIIVMAPRIAHSASTDTLEISAAPGDAPALAGGRATHDIAIETVAQGREGLELSARLAEDGGLIELPVTWSVSTAMGEPVYASETPIAEIALEPGDYRVDIRYGAVHLAQAVTLVDGTRLIVSFVLDAGGIRILPRLQGLGLPAKASRSRVYALSGFRKGQLVASSQQPGEILRVPAGEYRIESHFDKGNASAVADVTVKPGRMSAVEIDHAAGLARLAFVGAPDAGVLWRLADADGNALPPIEGIAADVVLKPGTYTAVAQIGDETLSAKFAIGAGQSRDIILGN
jgi:hypothetical protein